VISPRAYRRNVQSLLVRIDYRRTVPLLLVSSSPLFCRVKPFIISLHASPRESVRSISRGMNHPSPFAPSSYNGREQNGDESQQQRWPTMTARSLVPSRPSLSAATSGLHRACIYQRANKRTPSGPRYVIYPSFTELRVTIGPIGLYRRSSML